MTTVLAGMLIPSDSVSVANTTRTSPAANRSSTVSLKTGEVEPPVSLPRAADPFELFRSAGPPSVRTQPQLSLVQRNQIGVGDQLAVVLDVHRVELPPDQVQVLQWHRALLLDHDAG